MAKKNKVLPLRPYCPECRPAPPGSAKHVSSPVYMVDESYGYDPCFHLPKAAITTIQQAIKLVHQAELKLVLETGRCESDHNAKTINGVELICQVWDLISPLEHKLKWGDFPDEPKPDAWTRDCAEPREFNPPVFLYRTALNALRNLGKYMIRKDVMAPSKLGARIAEMLPNSTPLVPAGGDEKAKANVDSRVSPSMSAGKMGQAGAVQEKPEKGIQPVGGLDSKPDPNADDHGEALPNIAVDDVMGAVLGALSNSLRLLTQDNIKAACKPYFKNQTPDVKTIRPRLTTLRENKLLEAPSGEKKGVRLTMLGQKFADKHAAQRSS